MDKCEIEKPLASKSDRVTFADGSGKSDVWPHFHKVNVDGDFCGHVRCKACHCLARDGTSGLTAHRKSCPSGKLKASGCLKITCVPGFVPSPERHKISAAEESELADVMVDMCAKDIRPFSIVKALAAKLVSLGAQYGNVVVADALPSERTVLRHVENVAARSKEKLKDDLMRWWRIAITCDMRRPTRRI